MIEEALIEGCRQGSREAQRALYAQTSDRTYRLLLRMTGNPDDAFDLAQDVYVKVFTSIHQFQGSSGLSTWMYRIAINEAQQWLRRRGRYAVKVKLLEQTARGADASRDGENLEIRDAIARLPEYERTLIVLRHFDELSYDEIARITGKPAGTIASALNRARRILRDLLEPAKKPREDPGRPVHLTR